ncbi:MAG TPA: hypothetical protein DDZ68_10745 [Parvularcula sp.]|nr:hypothetical protein [Parvularcula sp.]HBS33300.1 hypothetical protein [Parvularcula sp.]HBS35697.1 hypothetical protein [Parvularcula sp.]
MRAGGERGFTIIEALVAVMILAIAATTVMQAFAAGARISAQRAARFQLFSEAQARLAVLRAEIAASPVPLDHVIEVDGRLIRERAALVDSRDLGTTSAALFQVTVSISESPAPDRPIVAMSDFAIVSTIR